MQQTALTTQLLWIGLAAVVLLNVCGFVLMAWDKRRARNAGWRVPEKTLIGFALVGGSVGVYAGMRLFRHKTLHRKFSWGVPAIMATQACLLVYVAMKFW